MSKCLKGLVSISILVLASGAYANPGSTKGIVADIDGTRLVFEAPSGKAFSKDDPLVYNEFFLFPTKKYAYEKKILNGAVLVQRVNYGDSKVQNRISLILLLDPGCEAHQGRFVRLHVKTNELIDTHHWKYTGQSNEQESLNAIGVAICNEIDANYVARADHQLKEQKEIARILGKLSPEERWLLYEKWDADADRTSGSKRNK